MVKNYALKSTRISIWVVSLILLSVEAAGASPSFSTLSTDCRPASSTRVKVICAPADLALLEGSSDRFELGKDIDLFGRAFNGLTSFKGALDGRGFAVKNMSIVSTDHDIGFIQINEGTLRNINFQNAKVTCDVACQIAGAAAAYNFGYLENIHTSGVVVGGIAGGLTGETINGTVTRGSSSATVYGSLSAGGISGNGVSSDFYYVFFDGKASAFDSPNSAPGLASVGGIVGSLYHGTIINAGLVGRAELSTEWTGRPSTVGGISGQAYDSTFDITYSGSNTRIVGESAAGGILGYMAGSKLNRSYSAGSIQSHADTAAGLVADTQSSSVPQLITNCFTKARLTGPRTGGLVGTGRAIWIGSSYSSAEHQSVSGQVSESRGIGFMGEGTAVLHSYWNRDLAPLAPQNPNARSGLHLTELGTFEGWDFLETWTLPPGSSPLFAWMLN